MKNQSKPNSRRKFLFAASLGGAGAAAAMVAGKQMTTDAGAAPSLAKAKGYHATEHIQKYYKTTLV